MKKIRKTLLFTVSISSILLICCKSKEEKAAELINNALSKTLYDFESYQPIETMVKEAKYTAYNDTTCWRLATEMAAKGVLLSEYLDEGRDAKEYMSIYTPSYYSSSYSDSKYYKYQKKAVEAYTNANLLVLLINNNAKELKKQIDKLDTSQIIGWDVDHSFRCKTKGGSAAIGHYRYVIDKDFKTILLKEDMDDEGDTPRKFVKFVISGWEDLPTMNIDHLK